MSISKRSLENYLLIDHRASPGMPSGIGAAGRCIELKTLTCSHCTTQIILNPWRERERHFCSKCDAYICDGCVAIARRPDYIHRTWKEIVDLVAGGYALIIGGTHGEPQLLMLKGVSNG